MADDPSSIADQTDASEGYTGAPDVTPAALVSGSSAPDVSSPAVMPSPQSPGSPDEQQTDTDTSGPQNGTGGGGSMWTRILQGALTALAGVPQHGRSSFANGADHGANHDQHHHRRCARHH